MSVCGNKNLCGTQEAEPGHGILCDIECNDDPPIKNKTDSNIGGVRNVLLTATTVVLSVMYFALWYFNFKI